MQNNDCSWWAGCMDWSEKCLGVCIKFTTVESLIVWSCEVLLSVTFYRQLKFNLSPHLVSYLGKLSPKALRTWASAKIFPFWIHWRVQVPHDVPFSKNVTCNLSFFFFFLSTDASYWWEAATLCCIYADEQSSTLRCFAWCYPGWTGWYLSLCGDGA